MWNTKFFVLLIVIGATGIVTKRLREAIPGKHSIDSPLPKKSSCTGNIAYNKESTTLFKPEWSGSPMVQMEKYQENRCDKRRKRQC
jgi:hypothetical protein